MVFGTCGYPEIEVDKQMDKYSQKMPGIRHRLKDHDPLRSGDYEDPQPKLDKWRIVYRIFHIATDCWERSLEKELRQKWKRKIRRGYYPSAINGYFWRIIERIAENPLCVYEVLPWTCETLPSGWVEYIKNGQKND